MSFDPSDETVSALAIKFAGCKRRRIVSDEQKAALLARLGGHATARVTPLRNADNGAQIDAAD